MSSYLMYLRKSRADIEEEKLTNMETLARHEETLKALAVRKGLHIGDTYREVVSGDTIEARPMMQRVLREVRTGMWAGVVVMDVDRLARGDTTDQGAVQKAFFYSGAQIVTPAKTYDPANEFDMEYFEFGLFMSRREYNTIKRRLSMGRYAAQREGKFIGSVRPYGYERVKLKGKKGWTLTPKEDEAKIVKLIFDLAYNNGMRSAAIATYLNRAGIPAPKGEYWTYSGLESLMSNVTYAGKIRANTRRQSKEMDAEGRVIIHRYRPTEVELYDGLHPAIVPLEQFLAVKAMKKDINIDRSVLKNPLAGLLYCGRCGRAMRRHVMGGDVYMECPERQCVTSASTMASVEAAILKALSDWGDELVSGEPVMQKTSTVGLDVLKAEEANLGKQMSNAYKLVERGIYDDNTFLQRRDEIQELQARNKAAIVEIECLLQAEEQRRAAPEVYVPKVKKLLEVYNMATIEEKNEMLKEVLEKVTYTRDVGGRWAPKDSFEIVIYPRA